ncbi:MAG TPA: 4Fe-4S binding protein [Dehalococcoidia bacterium]|nr:4Fe-4S binding protein [Dehalococcoidia bacterium]
MSESSDAYKFLAEKHKFGDSETYLRVLRFLMTPQQAEMVAQLPGSFEEVAQRTGLEVDRVKKDLGLLHRKGVVIPTDYKNPESFIFCKHAERMWEICESLMGLDDLYTDEETKQLFKLWDDWKNTDYADMNAERWHNLKAMGIQALRVVPAYKAILDSPEILPHEDAREMVRVQPLVTVVSCSCRKHKGMMGNPCSRTEADPNCLQFAKSAEYTLSRGHGREVSVDEAISIIDRNEEDGLVHVWVNHAKVAAVQPYALCSCCRCCCTVWHYADLRGVANDEVFAKSRYEARVDQDLCDGCQDCVDRCQFDAIEMQKVEGSKRLKAVVDPEKCFGCGVCTLVCEPGALRMHLVRPPEHIPA